MNKIRKTRKTKKYKQNGGADPYLFKGKKICGDRFDLYFNEIFASSNFYVYSLCRDKELNDCNETLAKIYKLGGWKTRQDIDEEAQYMQTAYNLGVSPKFLGIEYCNYDGKDYAILIIQKYGSGNLTDLLRNNYYEENKEVINRHLKQILDTLYDNNIDQDDLHSDNFLYSMNENGDIEFKIIDFDKAKRLGSERKRNYIIDNLYKSEEEVNLMLNNYMSVSFGKFARSASGDAMRIDDIDEHHAKHPRKKNEVRPNDKGVPGASLFGTSPTAFGYATDPNELRFQTNISKNESMHGPDPTHRTRIRNTVEYANDTWTMIDKNSMGAWFSNNKETIFLTAAVLAAAGFAFCARGIKKRSRRNLKKKRKTKTKTRSKARTKNKYF